jgi:hypothetical protein
MTIIQKTVQEIGGGTGRTGRMKPGFPNYDWQRKRGQVIRPITVIQGE